MIGEGYGRRPDVRFDEWRPGDQRYYVSDTRKFQDATGWVAKTDAARGVNRLAAWLCEARGLSRRAQAGREVGV
jgi:CDP-paratose 2-epimerase